MQRTEAISRAISLLHNLGQDSCKLSAELILAHILGCSRLDLIMDNQAEISDAALNLYQQQIVRLSQGEPLAYILGEREFYGLTFQVSPKTLIPRPETELLIDLALKLYPQDTKLLFADFGTGSGNIGLTLAHLWPNAFGILLDKSLGALQIASKNAKNLHVQPRVKLLCADFISPPLKKASFDLILANPPYIALAEKQDVMPCVLNFEPKSALFSPNNGSYHLEACVRSAHLLLKQGGYLLVEHGFNQGECVRRIFATYGFTKIQTEADLAGHERVTLGCWQSVG